MAQNLLVYAVLAIALVLAPALGNDLSGQYGDAGPNAVETRLETWHDPERDRALPVKLYIPDGDGPHPVIVFSHGLGGTREAAPYLGEHWASHGFLGVFVQHPGTDASLWQGAESREALIEQMRSGARDRTATRQRYEDIPFIVDEIERRAASGELAADPERLGMAGHSMGAGTTLAVMGRSFPMGFDFTETRFDAGIMFSPSGPPARMPQRMRSRLYADMNRPMMHLTGTEDTSQIQPDLDPADRTIPFRQIPAGEQYLVVFDGGDHAVFGGRRNRRQAAPDWYPEVQAITAQVSTAMWQAYLNEDTAALDWLNGNGFISAVREGDRAERRNIAN